MVDELYPMLLKRQEFAMLVTIFAGRGSYRSGVCLECLQFLLVRLQATLRWAAPFVLTFSGHRGCCRVFNFF
jgi:hypothetical protein